MIFITGKGGQLATELETLFTLEKIDYKAFSRAEWDISHKENGINLVEKHQPTVIINCAAYNAVDKAEEDSETANLVNHLGPKVLAEIAKESHCLLFHVSTDFIFGPASQTGRPLTINDTPDPQSVYAKSKLAGEKAVQSTLTDQQHGIIRTSWVYSSHGSNFVKTILKLASNPNREVLTIIEDQIGRPTSAKSLANFIFTLYKKQQQSEETKPLYHYSNSGIASWYDFADEVVEYSHKLGLLDKKPKVIPIPTEAYPLPAKRPNYSVMNIEEARTLQQIPYWKKEITSSTAKDEGSSLAPDLFSMV